MYFLVILILSTSLSVLAQECQWCVLSRPEIKEQIIAYSKLPPKELLKTIENQKISVKILKSNRVTPNSFHWGKIKGPQTNLNELTKHNNLMGKTLCPNEHKLADENKITIFLADDAPKETLLHEYLHAIQIMRDKKWCNLSKQLWNGHKLTMSEHQYMLAHEWDVHFFLYQSISELHLSTEDKVGILSTFIQISNDYKQYNEEANKYANDKSLKIKLNKLVAQYLKEQRQKKGD